MSGTPVIDIKGASFVQSGRTLLHEVDFQLNVGEFTYLIGNTGTGKSSFLKLLYGEFKPTAGTIRVGEFQVDTLSEAKIPFLRRSLGIVFQDFQLLQDRSIYDNIAFALEVTGAKSTVIKQRTLEVLALVGLNHKRDKKPFELSGGEQQRISIARALANEPKIMLADEPTGNLDPEASAQIMQLLQQINNRGMAVLMITHNHDLVRKYPARTLKLADGKLQPVVVGKSG
jgi:cell division transport system ATP-binding protein